jgi:CBS domain-containing protein
LARVFFFLTSKSSLFLPLSPQIGVVSDFDLLSLDIPDVAPNGIFPAPGGDWASFFSAQVAAASVRDVMTSEPLVVRGGDAADAAARTLLSRKVRRLPVVDDAGKLIGLFSRSDVLKAAWEARRGVESRSKKQ